MHTGLTSVTFRKHSVEDVIKIAEQCKLEFIEWGSDVHARPDSPEDIDKIVSMLKDSNVKSISYGSYYRAGVQNEFSFESVLSAAKRLGVKLIRIWAGNKESDEISDSEYEVLKKDLRRIVDLAAKEGVCVATEYHHGTYTNCAESTLKMLEDVPGLYTYWQENQKKDFSYNLRELKMLCSKVKMIHVFNMDNQNNRHPLKDVNEKWQKYTSYIESVKDLPFLLEFVKDDSIVQAEEDSATLNDLKNILQTKSN